MTSAEITRALARHIDYRRNVIVPRCHFAGAEADVLVLRPSDWLEEIEIKISVADFKREWETKAAKHERLVRGGTLFAPADESSTNPKPHKIRRFWFAIPLDLWPKIGPMLPAHVGCYTLAPQMWRGAPIGGLTVAIARPAPALPLGRKLTADERMELLRLLALRFWDVEAKETPAVPA